MLNLTRTEYIGANIIPYVETQKPLKA